MIVFEYIAAFLILAGAFFALIGSYGMVRLGDFFQRTHAPTKATTLGVGFTVLASSFFFSSQGQGFSIHEILITVFLFITAPASAHTLIRAAIHTNAEMEEHTQGKPWKD